MDDYEDAVVAAGAEAARYSAIITRNVRDFGGAPVRALTPGEFLVIGESACEKRTMGRKRSTEARYNVGMTDRGPANPLYDLHAHVLPDLDDGAPDDETALAMLRTSAGRGVTHVVVTPHSYAVTAAGGRAVFEERLARAQALTGEHRLGLELLPGMEVRLVPEAADRLAAGEYWPLGSSRCVLTEFDYTQWAAYAEEALFAIALAGYTPLLAHIERILPLLKRPELVTRFVERGCYTQITAMSLLGGMGPEAREGAERFLRRGLVHVVASDMHRPSGSRQPLPEGTYERLRELMGEADAEILLHTNPAAVIEGRPLQAVVPVPAKRRRLFWWT